MHAGQVRKGSGVPYVAHLLAVSAIAIENGADEEVAIAALLHDTLEDTPATYEDLLDRFGQRVADIVRACSDTEVVPKPPWRERKEAYLAHLRSLDPVADADILVVSLADKLHNARALLSDHHSIGDELWARFRTGSAADQIWVYRELADIFLASRPGDGASELDRLVSELEQRVTPA